MDRLNTHFDIGHRRLQSSSSTSLITSLSRPQGLRLEIPSSESLPPAGVDGTWNARVKPSEEDEAAYRSDERRGAIKEMAEGIKKPETQQPAAA